VRAKDLVSKLYRGRLQCCRGETQSQYGTKVPKCIGVVLRVHVGLCVCVKNWMVRI
jgi:hypothetical protein